MVMQILDRGYLPNSIVRSRTSHERRGFVTPRVRQSGWRERLCLRNVTYNIIIIYIMPVGFGNGPPSYFYADIIKHNTALIIHRSGHGGTVAARTDPGGARRRDQI